jgi:hypothetical protein
MSHIRARLAQESGWGLVSAVIVLGILISMSLPLLSLVDAQQRQSAQERKSESSFNLAEAAFDAGLFVLSSEWPATALGAYPATCTADTASPRCPDPELLNRSYAGPDYSARGWTVRVRDDGASGDYYDEALIDGQPSWDANGNAKMWVRADGRSANRDRTVVALVRRQDQFEPFPRNSMTAGWFGVSNNGNKVMVDTKGVSAQPAPVAVRCTAATPPPSPGCLEYRTDRKQVSPNIAYTGYSGDTAVPEEVLERFRARAEMLGSYYPSGCPQSPAGELVFIENGDCGYSGGGDANDEGSPGMLIIARGSVSFSGSMAFHGLVYAANLQHSTGSVVTIQGAATVFGSIAVDWGGGVSVGSNGRNMVFDDRVFPLIKSFGSAAVVQGTWRELPAS